MLGSLTRAGAVAACLLVVSCAERVASIERDAASASVVVRLDPTGAWEEARFVPRGDRAALEAEEGSLLVRFDLPPEGLLDHEGRPLGGASAPELVAERAERAGDPSAAGCGRCRVPGTSALRLGPGDACPVPPAIPGRVTRLSGDAALEVEDPVLVEAIRSRLRVSWPGACDTEVPSDPRALALEEVCGLSPVDAPVRASRLAIDPGGAVLAARSGFAALVGESGVGVSLDLPGTFFGDLLAPPVAGGPFTLAAGGLLQLDFRGGLRAARLPPRFREARGLARLVEGELHVFGSATAGGPAIARCSLDARGGTMVCIAEQIECGLGGGPIVDAAPTSGGGVAVGLEGVIYRRGPRGRWSCDARERLGLDGQAGFRPTRVEAVGQLGDRVFVCADGLLDGGPGAIGILSMDASRAPSSFEVADAGPGLACRGFVRTPGSQDGLLMLGAFGGGVLLGPRGQVLGRCDASLGCLPEVRAAFRSAAPHGFVDLAANARGEAAALDFSGRVHRLEPGRRAARVVYGDPGVALGPAAALADRAGEAWVFDGDLGPRRLLVEGEGCEGLRLERARPASGWSHVEGDVEQTTGAIYPGTWLDRARAAASVGETFLVGGERLGDAPAAWLRRVDVEAGRVVETPLAASRVPVSIVALPAGRALWMTEDALFWVEPEGLELRPVEMAWDDPSTEAVESAPTSGGAWRGATVSGSVVWAFGAGRAARVLLGPSGVPVAEAWYGGVLGLGLGAARDVWSAAAVAPDQVFTLERVYGFDGRADLRFGLLAPACARFGRPLGYCLTGVALEALTERRPEAPGPLAVHAGGLTFATFLEGLAVRAPLPAGRPLGFVEDGAGLAAFFEGLADGGLSARFLPFGLVEDAIPFSGGLLFAGRGAVAAVRVGAP